MSQASNAVDAASAGHHEADNVEQFQTWLVRSPAVARALVVGLPSLGMLASLSFHLPPFSALMAGCFLLAAALVCRRAILTFAGATLRLLVMARVVLIAVMASLLFCTTGAAWEGLVSGVLLWLAADRLLGRRALHDLFKICRPK